MKLARTLPWMVALGVTAGLALALAIVRSDPHAALVSQWREKLAVLDPSQADAAVESLRQSGDDGLAVVVALLADESPAARRAVRRTLIDELDECQALGLPARQERLRHLAAELHALAARPAHPDGRRVAADLAARILATAGGADDQMSFDCEETLRLAAGVPVGQEGGKSGAATATRRDPSNLSLEDQALGELGEIPGGGLGVVPAMPPSPDELVPRTTIVSGDEREARAPSKLQTRE